jgi:hypothetical protein
MLRVILHVLAVIFLLAAAFKVKWGTEHVVWFFLGIAAWCAACLPLEGVALPARRARSTD